MVTVALAYPRRWGPGRIWKIIPSVEQHRQGADAGEFQLVEATDTVGGRPVTKSFYGVLVGESDCGSDGAVYAYRTHRSQYAVVDAIGSEPSLAIYESLAELLGDERLAEDLRAQMADEAGEVLVLDI